MIRRQRHKEVPAYRTVCRDKLFRRTELFPLRPCGSHPMQILYAGSCLKMVFYNAQIYIRIKPKLGLCLYFAVFIRQLEFLLIHCRRRKQCCLNSRLEPLRGILADVADLLRLLARVSYSFCLAVRSSFFTFCSQ